ncbi:hypothetical protein OFN04_25935, partial [Escherichia coli]|nr:hypothetical protein [Escherichia coli]
FVKKLCAPAEGLTTQNCRYSASVQAKKSGQDTCLYSRHTVGTPNILVRAAPRHPANTSRRAKKFRVPLTVPEFVKR